MFSLCNQFAIYFMQIMEGENPMIITQPANRQTNQHSSDFVDPPKTVNDNSNLLSFL